MKYIYQLKKWPELIWDEAHLAEELATVRHRQGRLLGRMEGLGFKLRAEAVLQSLTQEILKSSEIEGETLDREQVRSSLARRLGMDVGGVDGVDRRVEGVVEMMLDATAKHEKPLTTERLFAWHASLFPTGRSGMRTLRAGAWRDDSAGPMQVVSGPMGREKVHFQAPDASQIAGEMRAFLAWFNGNKPINDVLKAAVAHLWYVTIHPFDDGNGRIARAIADLLLARSENTPQRFYSMSTQISLERKDYYAVLESTQKDSLDITDWLDWFLGCLGRAFKGSETILSSVFKKAEFWEKHSGKSFNERQRKLLSLLFDGFEGKMTSSKWAKIGKCSQDTASRDIDDLVKCAILAKNPGGGRSTSYSLVE